MYTRKKESDWREIIERTAVTAEYWGQDEIDLNVNTFPHIQSPCDRY